MTDRGFMIEDLVIPNGVKLNIPPFLGVQAQAAADCFTLYPY